MAGKWLEQYDGVVYTPIYDENGRDVQRVRVGGYIYDGGNLYATEDDARGYWRRDPFNSARRVSLADYRIAEQ